MNGMAFVVAFFALCALISLSGIVRPDIGVRFTIGYYKWCLKWCGLEGDIRSTPRAVFLYRGWSAFMLGVFTLFIIFALKSK